MGRGEAYRGFWWGKLRERDHLRGPGIDGRIILRWMFRTWDVGVLTGSSWLYFIISHALVVIHLCIIF